MVSAVVRVRNLDTESGHMQQARSVRFWCYRRILEIPQIARLSNEKATEKIDCETQLLHAVRKSMLEYFGQLMKGPKYELLQTLMMGKVERKRPVGRKRLSRLRNIKYWTNLGVELFHLTQDPERFQDLFRLVVV